MCIQAAVRRKLLYSAPMNDKTNMMRGRWLAAVALLSALAPAAARASPYAGIPGIRFNYYDIEGSTPGEIYASMRARSPMARDGSMGLGRTTWQMDVTWRERRQGSTCTVSEPKARMSISVLLPRLTTRELTREGLAYWRATLRGLDIHEAGHARIAWDHRNDFYEAADGASCKSINQVAKRVQARVSALQAAYDRDTRHGQSQVAAQER